MSASRPVRVLQIIDGLGGGGSERHVWEIVRLSNPAKVIHRVATAVPDDGTFVYAERLRKAGAYFQPASRNGTPSKGARMNLSASVRSRVPAPWKPPLKAVRSAAVSVRNSIAQVLSSASAAEQGEVTSAVLHGTFTSGSGEQSSDSKQLELLRQELLREDLYQAAIKHVLREYLQFRPDVIHGHTFHGFSLGLFLKLMFHRPMVYHVPALFSQLEDVEVGWLCKQFQQFHGGVDRFFTSYPTELVRIGVPGEKICRMNVVVDLEEVSRVQAKRDLHRANIRRAAGIADDALIALSVGRLHSSKGHRYAIEALPTLIKQFPQLHWIVIGAGSEEERRELESTAVELRVQDHTHIVGFTEEPLSFYAAADIYFRTPVYEAENLSSCQAMALGLPVVGFDTGGDTEMELIRRVGHGVLVPPRDAAALAQAAGRILSMPDRGRDMGKLGAEYCRAHLGFQRLIDNLTGVYSDLQRSQI